LQFAVLRFLELSFTVIGAGLRNTLKT